MLHSSTIKKEVRKRFKGVDIVKVSKKSFGIFAVHVKKEMPRSTKFGLVMGSTDFEQTESGVVLDGKIDWV